MRDRQWDVCIVGAGPAGLEAAVSATACGLETLVLDEQDTAGGHIYKGLAGPFGPFHMNRETATQGRNLLKRFEQSGAVHLARRTVWFAGPGEVIASHEGHSARIRARALIIANGAMERPVPFPGWTLPGVMGAGGAELLLRSSGILPQVPVVLAGNGPLLLLVAAGFIRAGVDLAALIDTGSMLMRLAALPVLPLAFLDLPYAGKGMALTLTVLKSRLKLLRASAIRAEGNGRVEQVVCATSSGECVIRCNSLLVHEGFIPRTHFSRLLRCDHRWHKRQRCWTPACTDMGESLNVPGVFFTGDGLHVDGADAARLRGRLAGIGVAAKIGSISTTEAKIRSRPVHKCLDRLLLARAYAEALFRPHPQTYSMPDKTLLCRCEHVTAGDVRAAVKEGCTDVNDIKLRTRAGMGHCQGRMCAQAMAEIAAAALETTPDKTGVLSVRPPLRPVSMQEFCEFAYGGATDNPSVQKRHASIGEPHAL